jgi:hypothetical protein
MNPRQLASRFLNQISVVICASEFKFLHNFDHHGKRLRSLSIIYIYIYIYIHKYIHTHTYINTYTYRNRYTHTDSCINRYAKRKQDESVVTMVLYTHAITMTYMHTRIYRSVHRSSVRRWRLVSVSCNLSGRIPFRSASVTRSDYSCPSTCVCVCEQVYLCMYLCVCICIYIYICIHTYVTSAFLPIRQVYCDQTADGTNGQCQKT